MTASKPEENKAIIQSTQIPILPLNSIIGLPGDTIAFNLSNTQLIQIVKQAYKKNSSLFTSCSELLRNTKNGVFGVIAEIIEINEQDTKKFKFKLKFSKRVELINIKKSKGISLGEVRKLTRNPTVKREELKAWDDEVVTLLNDIKEYIEFELPDETLTIEGFDHYVSHLATRLDFKHEDRLLFLEGWSIKRRVYLLVEVLTKLLTTLKIRKQLREKTTAKINKLERHAFLQEEKKIIDGELNKSGRSSVPPEYQELETQIKNTNLPLDVREVVEKEFTKLCRSGLSSPHSSTSYDYIETVIQLPWNKLSEENNQWNDVESILSESHFGLETIKDRILRYLAVHHLSKTPQGSIICLVGPPGVGKTSFARAIASALGRPFIKKSLGGVRDESEIRGHRRTYVGSMPGRILQGIKKVGVSNPVFLLDEVDKIAEDHRGNPADALLEVLDIEENKHFSDHYLEMEFDLSKVFWVLTANNESKIPFALRDRLEMIHFNSYTIDEKLHIASQYLIQKNLKRFQLENISVDITEDILRKIILSYTREAGVRDLDRKIAALIQECALTQLRKTKKQKKWKVTQAILKKTLGHSEIKRSKWIKSTWAPGVMAGLAWTMYGGSVLKMECSVIPGSSKFKLTGKMGEVMKESAHTAYTFIKNHAKKLGLEKEDFEKKDFHIHMPAGAVSKEGPSAGLGIALLLYSALKQEKAKAFWALTGEISLHGKVLPIGGVKEKILAAKQQGFSGVVLPKANEVEVKDIPYKDIEQIEIIYVSTFWDAFKIFFTARK